MKDGFFIMIIASALITYLLRFIPTWLSTSPKFSPVFKKKINGSGWVDAVGPSAILSLFIVSVMPDQAKVSDLYSMLPSLFGICMTGIFYMIRKDIVISTLSGIGSYSLAIFLLGNTVLK